MNLKIGAARLIMLLFSCLPIKKNKLILFSYYGSQYGDSPKYISEYILKHYPDQRFHIVWAFTDPDSKHHLKNVRKVKMMSLRYFYTLCTSKVIITNYRMTDAFVKRKNQYYIQTWHSSLRLKQIEKDAAHDLPAHYVEMAKKDSAKCDLLLSGSKYSTEIFKRAFWYGGEIFEHGTPRNDVLVENNASRRRAVLDKLNIRSEKKVLLYAPTFRKNSNLEIYHLDWKKITRRLQATFGGQWTVLVKLHPHLIAESDKLLYGDNVVNVTSYDDIQELLLAADVLISDYSSLIFDYAITKRPCFLYVPDVEEYTSQDRKLYFEINDLPFINAVSHNDLLGKMINFDDAHYKQQLEQFMARVGSFEKGNASEHVARHINEICYGKHSKRSDNLNEAV